MHLLHSFFNYIKNLGMMSLTTCNFEIDSSINYSFLINWAMIFLVASHKETAGLAFFLVSFFGGCVFFLFPHWFPAIEFCSAPTKLLSVNIAVVVQLSHQRFGE